MDDDDDYHIRQIRQVQSSLDINSAIILANSLVSSKLDYCNSLYYGLPAVSLDRLQKVQNSLARVVDPSVRRHHQKLHWLSIHQRIHFKIASLTFKTLQDLQPSYLSDRLTPYVPSRNLRSLDKHLLTVPDVQQMVAVHLLLLHRLFGIHYLLNFVPVLHYPRFSPA